MFAHAVLLLMFATAPVSTAQEPPPPLDEPAIAFLRAQESDILERVQRINPEKYEELLALKASDPRAYLRALWRISRLAEHGPPHGERVTPEIHEKRRELETIRRSRLMVQPPPTGDALAQIRADVLALAEELFVLKQAERRLRIEHMQAALAELEADVARRDEEREARIANFVDTFLQQPASDL